MSHSFRNATIKDIQLLNKVSIASKKYWKYPDEWLEKWCDELTLKFDDFKKNVIIVIEISNIIIGFCSISENSEQYEIEHLWILPEFIGKGYGKLPLDQSLHQVIKKEKDIIVIADPNAESFYKKQGFITFSKVKSFPKNRFLPIMKKSCNKI